MQQIFHLRILLIIFIFMAATVSGFGQKDSIKSTVATKIDTVSGKLDTTKVLSIQEQDFLLTQKILKGHPYYKIASKPQTVPYIQRTPPAGKEIYFYIVISLFLFLAVLRVLFEKYFSDLMQLFFKTTIKQRQIKQQLIQTPLPSLLFNLLFVLIAAFYLALSINEFSTVNIQFGWLFIYLVALIALIYLAKYLVLSFMGWLLQLKSLTSAYTFIVFTINKIIAIVLLPLCLAIALGNLQVKTVAIVLSWILVGMLLFYRFYNGFNIARKQASTSLFHFILYVLAFEILPVMTLYKGYC